MALPLSIVDHPSFRNFMFDADSKYKIIHRRDLTRSYLRNLRKICASKLMQICDKSNFVSLTLDMWCDRRMRSYLGITMHTIMDDKYKSFLLSFDQLEGKHSGERFAAEFDRVVQLYNLNGKIVRLVTDNASNNTAAFDSIIIPGFEDYFDGLAELKSDSGSESSNDDSDDKDFDTGNRFRTHEIDDTVYRSTINDSFDEEYLRLPCFAHCPQLVVNDGLKAMSDIASVSLKKVYSCKNACS